MSLAPTLSKLNAVNLMLAAAGESKVSTLISDGENDTEVAQQILDESIIEVLTDGWDFNTVKKTVSPTTQGNIIITDNYLRVDGEDANYRDRLSVRSNHLYNLDDDTDVFTGSVTIVVTQNLAWEDIPSAVRYYIARYAARVYQNRVLGDPATDQILAQEELRAWERCKKHDSKAADRSWVYDSRSASGYIARRRVPWRTGTGYSDHRPL